MADSKEDLRWKTELTLCLSRQSDLTTLRELCRGRKVPIDCRLDLWKIALNVVGKPDALLTFDGVMDISDQDILKEDCILQAEKLKLVEEDEEEVAGDMEGLITFYCKSRGEKYRSSSGLVELLSPFITQNLPLSEVYNCFYAMQSKYIPRECYRDGKPFVLFRQLLQYHDPHLCSFLDSRKIPPDLYAQKWLRSLFVSVWDPDVVQAMWDYYFLQSDQYFVFFLMLVMVLNAKDQIFEMSSKNKSSIVEYISNFPSQLGVDDIEDFCTLAQYYVVRTPQSYRKDFQSYLFGSKVSLSDYVSNSLCLQVSLPELLEAIKGRSKEDVRFFLVDCRPSDQYNSGHLPTAFHLDCNLMLQAPSEFHTAVSALFEAQEYAIEAGSNAGGEHLCFMGSGRETEDQYVNMVVANFLQRGTHFVSIAKGGYAAVHELLVDDLVHNLIDHNANSCIVCSPELVSSGDESHDLSCGDISPAQPHSPQSGIVDKLSNSLRTRSADVKERLGRIIADSKQQQERHVSEKDKTGKRYRGVNLDIFSIDDPDDTTTSSGDEHNEAVNISTWIKRSDVIRHFPCSEISSTGQMYSSYILLTSSNLFILREIVDEQRSGWARIQSRPHLTSIVKITSKKKHPDLITFKYGTSDGDVYNITGSQRFLIPNSAQAMKKIKEKIFKIIE